MKEINKLSTNDLPPIAFTVNDKVTREKLSWFSWFSWIFDKSQKFSLLIDFAVKEKSYK